MLFIPIIQASSVGDLHKVTQVILPQPGYSGENHRLPYASCILHVSDDASPGCFHTAFLVGYVTGLRCKPVSLFMFSPEHQEQPLKNSVL